MQRNLNHITLVTRDFLGLINTDKGAFFQNSRQILEEEASGVEQEQELHESAGSRNEQGGRAKHPIVERPSKQNALFLIVVGYESNRAEPLCFTFPDFLFLDGLNLEVCKLDQTSKLRILAFYGDAFGKPDF